jgi:hypothetical protein
MHEPRITRSLVPESGELKILKIPRIGLFNTLICSLSALDPSLSHDFSSNDQTWHADLHDAIGIARTRLVLTLADALA